VGKIRRKFTAQFKNEVCAAIQGGGVTLAEICREHQLSRTVVERWLEKFSTGPLVARPSARERELEKDNEKLKAKVGELTMQIDALKKFDEWTRRRQSVNSSIVTGSNWAQLRRLAEPLASPSPATTTRRKSPKR
jgi:transposase